MMEKQKNQLDEQEVLSNDDLVNFIVFSLGSEEYGVRIEQVKEVTLTPTIYKMPRTPSFIQGVANIRGDIIAILDLEERFGIKRKTNPLENNNGSPGYILVIENHDYTIGFNVEKVPETFGIPSSMLSKTPEFFDYAQINKNYIDGIGKVDDRLIIILNVKNILNFEEIQQMASVAELNK